MIARLLLLVGLLTLLSACHESPAEDPCPGTFTVSPQNVVIVVGDSIIVTGSLDNCGSVEVPVLWSVRDSTIVQVRPQANISTAVLYGRGVGVTTVTVASPESRALSGSIVVQVQGNR